MLHSLDAHLTNIRTNEELNGLLRFIVEFLYFAIKEARACLFAGAFFSAVILIPHTGIFGLPRYDALLLFALGFQAWMVAAKLETLDEFKAITIFHLIGFALETFKTSSNIGSWSYPGVCQHSCPVAHLQH